MACERSKALAAVDDDNSNGLRDRLVAVCASERLARERLQQGPPQNSVMVASVHRRMRILTEEMAAERNN